MTRQQLSMAAAVLGVLLLATGPVAGQASMLDASEAREIGQDSKRMRTSIAMAVILTTVSVSSSGAQSEQLQTGTWVGTRTGNGNRVDIEWYVEKAEESDGVTVVMHHPFGEAPLMDVQLREGTLTLLVHRPGTRRPCRLHAHARGGR